MTDDETTILRLLRDREAAVAAGEAERVVAPLAPDAVVFDLPPPLQHGGDAARGTAALRDWFGTWDGPVVTELRDPVILVSGDLAVAYGLLRMRGVKRESGPLDEWSRSTVVLTRRGGGWRIVHEHASFPMRMDGSGTAATDLRP